MAMSHVCVPSHGFHWQFSKAWLQPFTATGQLVVLREHVAVSANVDGDRVLAVTVRSTRTGDSRVLRGLYFVNATELGDLLPLPACKNIGTTHITGGCYRLHPVEWGIAEAVGALVSFAVQKKQTPHAIRSVPALLTEFQNTIRQQRVETEWRS